MRHFGLMTGIAVTFLTVVSLAQDAGRQGPPPGRQGGAGRGPQGPPITTLAGDVQNDLDRTRELFLNLVEAMPEDKFGFKPTPAQQSFGERAMHIAQADQFILGTLGGKTPAPKINAQASTKADILAALRQLYDWEMALMKEFNDQQLVERVMPPAFLGHIGEPRPHLLLFAAAHRGHLRSAGGLRATQWRDAAGEPTRGSLAPACPAEASAEAEARPGSGFGLSGGLCAGACVGGSSGGGSPRAETLGGAVPLPLWPLS